MGFKINNKKIIETGNMSADVISEVVDAKPIYTLGLYAKWTGTPTGALRFQGSANNVDWFNLQVATAITGAAGEATLSLDGTPWLYVRAFYDFTSGTGVLDVWLNSKGQ
jgi:hypothetical protein